MQALRHFESLLHEDSFRAARLVAQARDGSRDAFDQLMLLHEARLRAFLCVRVDNDAIEDTLQETRIAAYLALPKFGGKSRFKVWLFGIAHHKCADHYRSARGREDAVSYEAAGLDTSDPLDRYAAADSKILVAQLLKTLSESQTEVLELYYFADLTLSEIAMILDRSLNTIKARFYRAHAAAARAIPGDSETQSGAKPINREGIMPR